MTEDRFLDQLHAALPQVPGDVVIPVGDDCAAFDGGAGRWFLIGVDQLVAQKHYVLDGDEPTEPALAGRKLLGRNLSDIAAMGGVPRFCVVAAAFGPACDEHWMGEFHRGLIDLAAAFEVALIGGDLASTPQDVVASLTIIGEVEAGRAVLRKGARAGDDLWATGCFGDSLATGHHLTFEPRCREGAWLADRALALAMMDVSDGLLLDLDRLCRASGIGCVLDTKSVPRRTPETALQEALCGGEDYELIVAVDRARREELLREWPFDTPLRRIGCFVEPGDARIRDSSGTALEPGGWDHFARANGGMS